MSRWAFFQVVVLVASGVPASGNDAPVTWETTCAPRGCLLQADVLRGDSGDPPDGSDFHEHIGIDVALDKITRKPAYFAFHVDPNAQLDQGVVVAFAKSANAGKVNTDSDGNTKLDLGDCDDKSCAARVPLGVVKKGGRSLNLLDKFLKSELLELVYTRGGKQYRTSVPLSSFQKEYQRVLTSEFGVPVK